MQPDGPTAEAPRQRVTVGDGGAVVVCCGAVVVVCGGVVGGGPGTGGKVVGGGGASTLINVQLARTIRAMAHNHVAADPQPRRGALLEEAAQRIMHGERS